MEYNFFGKITLSDYIQFNQFHYKKGEKIFTIILVILIIAYLIFKLTNFFVNKVSLNEYINEIDNFSNENNAYIESLLNTTSNAALFFEIFLPIILFVVFFIFFSFITEKLIIPKVYKKYYDSNKLYSELSNYKINNEKIMISSDSGNAIIAKEKILKILYDADSIYVYIGLNMAYIIKSHYFENTKTFDELVLFMKKYY